MCRQATICRLSAAVIIIGSATTLFAQAAAQKVDWRHIGNSAIDLSLPSVATGRVDRVWYSQDGSTLYAQTSAGRIFQTADFEQWTRVEDTKVTAPNRENPPITSSPETRLKSSARTGLAGRVYAIGRNVYRS